MLRTEKDIVPAALLQAPLSLFRFDRFMLVNYTASRCFAI